MCVQLLLLVLTFCYHTHLLFHSLTHDVSCADVNFVFFAAVATALPIFVFTTPIFQMSPLDNTAQCALTVVASVVLLFMSYVEVASKVLKGLKGKKKQSAQCLSVFTSHAAFSAIFHANMVYVVSSYYI